MRKKSLVKNILNFFQKDIWKEKKELSSPSTSFIYRWLRIFISSFQYFLKSKGFDKASTLTFYTLLSIIPLIAIGFGITQALGFAENFSEQIQSQFASQPEVAAKLIEFSNSTLKTTKGGFIASFGIVILFWTVLRTIGNIETFFNEIWKVENPRTLWQEVKSYTPVILFFPIFLVLSNSAIIYMSTLAVATVKSINISFLTSAVVYLFHFISYLISWILLSLLYIYLPNTKVSWKAGFKAGIITGIIYFIWQWVYVTFQVKSASYGAIYGGFAAVPLFLIWLNYSWLIIIFGVVLCYNIEKESQLIKTKSFST